MIYIDRSESNPYINIATEEYVLKNFTEDILMLWQSEPSVVVGKHQNILAEINQQFVEEHQIPVIRRISGGGTVYHDNGNLNYTLITTNQRKDRLIDFKHFTDPILTFLKSHHINASFEGKNNLTINGEKFSGNSAHVFKNRVMHHGTILFDSELSKLNEAIKPWSHQMEDKAVKSIRATVTNLKKHFVTDISFKQFRLMLQAFLFDYFNISETKFLSKQDRFEIEKLVEEKYKKWEWNYGYSPKYVFENEVRGNKIKIVVKNGQIETIEMEPENKLSDLLLGTKHHKTELIEKFDHLYSDDAKKILYLKLFGY